MCWNEIINNVNVIASSRRTFYKTYLRTQSAMSIKYEIKICLIRWDFLPGKIEKIIASVRVWTHNHLVKQKDEELSPKALPLQASRPK